MKRRILLVASGELRTHSLIYERVLIHYLSDEIVAVIEPANAGEKISAFFDFAGEIPVISTLDEGFEYKPNHLLIGLSPQGGSLKTDWFPLIIKALQSRLHIINGLHQSLNREAEFRILAKKYNVRINDLRSAEYKIPKIQKGRRQKAKRILVIGSERETINLIGSIELIRAMKKMNLACDWTPTSLCGNIIKENSVMAQSVRGEILSAIIGQQISKDESNEEYIIIEGSGALTQAESSAVALGIMHGSEADGIIFTFKPDKTKLHEIPDKISSRIKIYEQILRIVKPAALCGLAIDTAELTKSEAESLISLMQNELQTAVCDPLRFGCDGLVESVKNL